MANVSKGQITPAKDGTGSHVVEARVSERGSEKHSEQSETSQMLPDGVVSVTGSWRAPIIIVSTLMAGLGFAMAHHFSNAYLNHKLISDVIIPQAWVFRLQTLFAFLVKMFLTISIGAAFVQHQWWNFHRRQFSAREIDAVTTVLGDIFSLFTFSAWRKVPSLVVAAFISWAVPLAAVISPGFLSITLNETQTTQLAWTPQLLFDSFEPFLQYNTEKASPPIIEPVTATNELWQIALSVGASGQMAPLSMPYRNMSYRYAFKGPAVYCYTVQDVANLTKTISETHNSQNLTSTGWTSWISSRYYIGEPGQQGTIGNSVSVAVGTHASYMHIPADNSNTNVTECILSHGIYDVLFDFRYPQQNLTVLNLTYESPVSYRWISEPFNRTSLAYAGIMQAFARLLVGFIEDPVPSQLSNGPRTVYQTSKEVLHINWQDAEATRTGLEQLFRNITLSLLSNEKFIKNSTQAEQIPISVSEFVNIYRYDHTGLFLAYGLAILGALLCALTGLHATWVNRGSYQNIFSTFMRSTDIAEWRSLLDSVDDGRDPLPRALAEVRLRMHRPHA